MKGETLRAGVEGKDGREVSVRASLPPQAEQRSSPPSPSARKRKGPRPKHIPQRMCVACRSHDSKRGLFRIVRTPEGQVEPDPTGRRNGRGAYLCGRSVCWEKALASGILARALNVEINTETLDALRRYAATLPLESVMDAAPTFAQSEGGNR